MIAKLALTLALSSAGNARAAERLSVASVVHGLIASVALGLVMLRASARWSSGVLQDATRVRVSAHARQRYHERIAKDARTADIITTVKSSEYLRPSELRSMGMKDPLWRMFYLINRELNAVFVMRRSSPGRVLLVTCYRIGEIDQSEENWNEQKPD